MQAAFVDIGLEKNAFLYVDEVVAPEGVEDVPRRDIQSLLRPASRSWCRCSRTRWAPRARASPPRSRCPAASSCSCRSREFVGVSTQAPRRRARPAPRDHPPLVPDGMGVIVRTVASGRHRARPDERPRVPAAPVEACQITSRRRRCAPEVVYTEMDLALRLVRDVVR